MEFLGLIAFILILGQPDYRNKINQLESEIKKIERNLKGESAMSTILAELINQNCELVSDTFLALAARREIECTILAVDEEWMKFTFTDKKGKRKTQIVRIDAIERVNLIESNQ